MTAAEREAEETRLVRVRAELSRACGSRVCVVVNGIDCGSFWMSSAQGLIADAMGYEDGGTRFALVLRDEGCEGEAVMLLDAREVAEITCTPEERQGWRIECVAV